MGLRAERVAGLLFASGFCALLYQMAWLREFRLIFGASTAASAAVLAIFIAGLGFGGLVLGKRVDEHPSPLGFYARLEAMVAVSAALTPWLLDLVRAAYIALGGSVVLGSVGGTVVRLLLSAAVLSVPTLLMGGTLPAAARSVATRDDTPRRRVALLYGVNTLGAVAGAFAGTFYMIEVFGIRRTLWLACLLNALVAMVARSWAQAAPSSVPVAEATAAPADEPSPPASPVGFVLASAAVVGFAFFLLELIWYRMLGPILGGTVFTFGLVLCVALLGIGIGGVAYSLRPGAAPPTLLGLAQTCLVEAVCVAVPYALGDRIALFAWTMRPLGKIGLSGQLLAWVLPCIPVVLPAAIVAGYQFPLLIGLLGRGTASVGRHVGLAYACNTAGAIAGSLAGGFGLIPLLSAPGAWRASAVVLLLHGAIAAALAAVRGISLRRLWSVPTLLVTCGLLLCATGPTAVWRHSGIGVGLATLPLTSPRALEDAERYHRRRLIWEGDGLESSVALVATGSGVAFVVNGKNDGVARSDAGAMVMSSLLGSLLHPDPRTGLIVGMGTGKTAGWLASVPAMERVDVVELESLVLDVARACAPVNRRALDNPKVHVTIGDARETLLVTRGRYDIVVSEPSNPYRAGVASLFTREYYEAVRGRLAEGGLFLQWVQAYEVDSRTVRSIYSTLQSVFPYVETWDVGPGDLMLIGSRSPVRVDAATLRARLGEEPYKSGIPAVWGVDSLEGVLSHFVARPSLAQAIAARPNAEINTDDRNIVEFGFARNQGVEGLSLSSVREVAILRGEDLPEVSGGDVDWDRVADARLRFPGAPSIWARLSPPKRALAQFFTSVNCPQALSHWPQVGRDPVDHDEALRLGVCLAEEGNDAALPWIQWLSHRQPIESQAVMALLRSRQGRTEEAVTGLLAVLDNYHSDPWPDPFVMKRSIELAGNLAGRDPAVARRVFPSLESPFAVRAFDEERLAALASVMGALPPGPQCVKVFRSLEPNVPWVGNWLTLRKTCYSMAGTTHEAAVAEADLAAYLSEEAPSFSAGLVSPAGSR